ncbi:unnamed protein product [Protopolystoma xenopodis]|uniref:Uncharacterized protein n=1 Tax=Protopolystoma xenopodis TaxID=117903 RepID=A0A3S5AF97_9PLAT|nr:unnamed protein product [Protopolystoma xenopodis]
MKELAEKQFISTGFDSANFFFIRTREYQGEVVFALATISFRFIDVI